MWNDTVILSWYQERASRSASIVPAKGEEDRESNEEEPPCKQNSHVAPDMVMRVGETGQVVVAVDRGGSRYGTTDTCACCTSRVFVLWKEIRNQIGSNAEEFKVRRIPYAMSHMYLPRYCPAMELIRHE